MATPNYSYEKRQRELAKKKKKAEKDAEKAARRAHGGTTNADPSGGGSDVADLPRDEPPPTSDAPTGGLVG